jgi:hypothetical protein
LEGPAGPIAIIARKTLHLSKPPSSPMSPSLSDRYGSFANGTKAGAGSTLSLLIAPKLRPDIGMDRAALQRRLQRAEDLGAAHGGEHRLSGSDDCPLDRGGHDVKVAKKFLRRLEATQAKHVADRDRLFKELANRS